MADFIFFLFLCFLTFGTFIEVFADIWEKTSAYAILEINQMLLEEPETIVMRPDEYSWRDSRKVNYLPVGVSVNKTLEESRTLGSYQMKGAL